MEKKSFYDFLKAGKELRDEYKNIKLDIKKTQLPETFKVFYLNAFSKNSVVDKQEFLEFAFSIYFTSICNNEGLGCGEFLKSIIRHKNGVTITKQYILDAFISVWDKSALHLPLYKQNKNITFKNLIKDFSMRDYILSFAHESYVQNGNDIAEFEYKRAQYKVSNATYFLFALIYLGDVEKINKLMSVIIRNKNLKLFEACVIDDFDDLIKAYLLAKGYKVQSSYQDSKDQFREIHEETQEKIDLMVREYSKIIDNLKETINELTSEKKVLEDKLLKVENELKSYTCGNKLQNKKVILIGDKGKKERYEEVVKKYNAKNFVFLDSFEDQSKIISSVNNSDIVFHMTEMSKHNVSNLLSTTNANVVLINKNSVSALESSIENL